MEKYDLIVIGAGPGGTPAAMSAARFGKKVLLVDKRDVPGGECLFEGCIPSKILENAANRFAMLKESRRFHIDVAGTEQIHWEAVLQDKAEVLQRRSQGALKQMEGLPSLTFMQGSARFVDAHTVEVGTEKFAFDNAVIASGATSHIPPFEGSGVAAAWTNADVFKEKTIPGEITFIGAGAINCELAQMFRKLGAKCRILQRSGRILTRIDEEAALLVQRKMIDEGIEIELDVTFGAIDKTAEGFAVSYTRDGKAKTLNTPHLLIATGRAANTHGLGLDEIGIAYDRHGIKTDEMLKTSLPHIFAVGDCTVGPKFAHWASYQAGIAIHNIFAPHPRTVDFGKLSWVLFSDPQIASAGITEADAASHGMEVEVERYDYAGDARAQIDKAGEGFIKFVIEKQSGIVLGVQVVSENASALSGEAALIVGAKLKVTDILGAIHPHPTLTEGFGKLAQSVFVKSMMRRVRGGHGKQ